MIEYNLFRKQENAEKKAKELGCKGFHKMDNGFMPCSSHKEFEKVFEGSKGEIEEFIDFDGNLSNSKIPILDPALHPKKTMDQTVAATRIPLDPRTKGMRFYYGESELAEVDMSGAFGYEETKDMTADETIEYLEKEFDMDQITATDRALEMGKSEERDNKSKYKGNKNFVGRPVLQEKELEEDILAKRSNNLDIRSNGQASDILLRNANALKKMAKKEGVSIRELFKMISRE